MLGTAYAALLGSSAQGQPVAPNFVLVRPTLALAVGQDGVPGSNVVYVAPGGSGNGTIGSPYGTLEAAHNHAGLGAGWTIVCRGGTYSRTSTFTPTKSGTNGNPITVMAYPGETVILDYGSEFAAYRTSGGGLWQVENASLKLWRSVSTGFGTAARVMGHWEEAGELWQLYGYKTTGPSETGTGANYYGPGVRIGSDGRLHIRFQRPDPAQVTSKWPSYQPGTSGGNWVIPSTEDPNDYAIYLARQNGTFGFTFNNVNYWTIHDINIMGCENGVLITGTCAGITIERALWRGCYVGVRKSNATTNDLVVRRIQSVSGRLDYFSWGFIKDRHGATEMDNQAFFNYASGGGGGTNTTVEDCFAMGYFDGFAGSNSDANMVIRYNWFEDIRDDIFQVPTNTNGVEIAYNVHMNTPLHDWQLSGGTSTGNFYVHHNVCWQRLPRLWDTNQGLASTGITVAHFSSGATGRFQPRQVYNNTIIVNGGSATRGGAQVAHCAAQSSNELALANSTFNNALIVYADRNDWVTGEDSFHNNDSCACDAYLQGVSNEELDHNHYCRVLAYATPRSAMIGPFYDLEDNGAVRQGGPYTFASAAALAGHPANLIGAENNGTSEDITNTGVGGMNAAAPLVDLEALDFRPKPGSALASGAKDLSSTGWPGASNAVWRGALDPNETSSARVGPRQPA
jgi:hypothetical protein